jgi:HSP20 family protein
MVEKAHTAGRLPGMYEPLRNLRSRIADWFAPPSEASATGETYDIVLELPGVDPEDIDVSVEGDNVVVKGEKRSEHTEEGRTFFFSEREYGAFLRSFRLPADAKTDAIAADCANGVLTLRVPKVVSEPEGKKRIKVRKTG